MRVLIVKLSSLGDVVHTMPVVHDIRNAHPDALIDWVVEPGFAPLVRRVHGIHSSFECAQRRWRKRWWTRAVREEWREFRYALRGDRYDAIIDFQGLTKSVLVARIARGPTFGLGNQTEGSAHEWPARWLIDHPIDVDPRIHALDRARLLASRVLGYEPRGAPRFGLRAHTLESIDRTLVFVHGSSRDDKLWPEAHWIELGRRVMDAGWRIALPHAGPVERERADRIAAAIGPASEVWPAMDLDAITDRMGAVHGVIGVDSGLSHIAVALDLPHVQLYNFPTSWRTGPQVAHGHSHQVSIEGQPTPDVDTVWSAWQQVWTQFQGQT
ncbi:lipopolysaccharide heptosyltransferase I [Piscinibacter sp. XHJ-5]|uniref:lipopolysaccharide heptosyltransferase I n=1 Tax=Piscinibacter sp. XHJ-5 TaxID=3037797 RepID=UPI0024528939|nr:lipopolysaccharide heptosyltransferase I [Piscinibacter sp. XHJ-5]